MKKLVIAILMEVALACGMQGQQLSAPAGGIVSQDAVLSGPTIDARAYGAKCDWNGTTGTNDLAAIQNAINAAVASNKELQLPSGACLIQYNKNETTYLNIPANANLTIRGTGENSSILKFAPDPADFVYYGLYVHGPTKLTLTNLQLAGPMNPGNAAIGSNNVATRGIWAPGSPGTTEITLDKVKISGKFFDGVDLWNDSSEDGSTDVTLTLHDSDITAYTQCVVAFTNNPRTVTDAAITAGSTTLTSATANFTAADQGKLVSVVGAGSLGSLLYTTVQSVTNATTAVLGAPASTTVTGAKMALIAGKKRILEDDNYLHDCGLSAAMNDGAHDYGHIEYIHPNISVRAINNRFDGNYRFAAQHYSSAGVPWYVPFDYSVWTGNWFGPRTKNGLLLSANGTEEVTGNQFFSSAQAIELNGNSAVVSGNLFHGVTNAVMVSPGMPCNVGTCQVQFTNNVMEGSTCGTVAASWSNSTWMIRNNQFNEYDPTGSCYAISTTNATTDYGLTGIVENNTFTDHLGASAFYLSVGKWRIAHNYVATVLTNGAWYYQIPGSSDPAFSVLLEDNTIDGTRLFRSDGQAKGRIFGRNNQMLNGASALITSAGDYAGMALRDALSPTPLASATTIAPGLNYNTYHVTGTSTIQTIVLNNDARTNRMYGGSTLRLIADGSWSLGNSGNILPKTTSPRTSGDVVNLIYDAQLDKWYEEGGGVGKQVSTPPNIVPFSATPVFDASLSNVQKITLTGNVSSSTLVNPSAGEQVTFLICQDATGGRTFAWPANVKGGGTVGTNGGSCTTQTFVYDGIMAYATGAAVVSQ